MEADRQLFRRDKFVLNTTRVFLVFLLLFAILMLRNFHTVEVTGDSMSPTLENGTHVLVSKAYWLVGPVKTNDIVVIRDPSGSNELYIKRVYGIGGDKIDWYNAPENWSLAKGTYEVPNQHFYVLGDNRPVSEDSRTWGSVRANDIIGKVIVVQSALSAAAKESE